MPNWCANTLSLRTDKQHLQTMLLEIKARFLDTESDAQNSAFNFIHPMPAELEGTIAPSDDGNDWYSWRIENWGTKWPETSPSIIAESERHLLVSFDTAWAPPFGVYERLLNFGFEVVATYAECGMGFAGVYRNGEDIELPIEYMPEKEDSEMLQQAFAGQGLPEEMLPPHLGG